MSTRGLIGFRCNDTDKLIYNHADSHPDTLGLKVLRELREVDNWNVILDRIESLVPIPEQRKLGEHSSMAEAEIRRAFPDLEYRGSPQNFYDLYQPLQGTLKPYLDGKLMFMPDASDFIHNSLHCERAYIANLDDKKFEVWKGLQSEPDSENERYPQEAARTGYYLCTMLRSYDLEKLPEQGTYLSDYFFFRDLTSSRPEDRP
ncbi:hypothetical protein [Pontiella sulfatireligans]|uniref:Uncharacterized protein n=1 Tax=Pontiella sulfatireligans TaxID=2750658 RepID=A0A6C2UGS9_9BACT|nr:hypothetical protein [Pontiella sulfatireligans]VGO19129.1 hypothetical protein SCARR_01185 [Pontiella sulfatireligans]